jgi:release factor glutamine methyltransferase
VSDAALLDELTALTGSRQESVWIVDAAAKSHEDPSEVAIAARSMATRRADGEPLQYVLGTWAFRHLELAVDERALIPRPETEQVVQVVLDRWNLARPGADGVVAVDLGCGTGAIGLSLAHELPDIAKVETVFLTDRSRDALELAIENARSTGVDRVAFALGDWFDALEVRLKGSIHILVSNPPYVAIEERPTLADELYFEPDEALFSPESTDGVPGFHDVAHVIANARVWMAPGGIFAVEMAEHHVDHALELAADAGFVDVEGFVDLAGKPRGMIGMAP